MHHKLSEIHELTTVWAIPSSWYWNVGNVQYSGVYYAGQMWFKAEVITMNNYLSSCPGLCRKPLLGQPNACLGELQYLMRFFMSIIILKSILLWLISYVYDRHRYNNVCTRYKSCGLRYETVILFTTYNFRKFMYPPSFFDIYIQPPLVLVYAKN